MREFDPRSDIWTPLGWIPGDAAEMRRQIGAVAITVLLVVIMLGLVTYDAWAGTWGGTKREAAKLYRDKHVSWYCGCEYSPHGTGGTIDPESCGYHAPKSQHARASRLEWEHIVPASRLRGNHPAWQRGGRKACEHDADCQTAIFDLMNLVPSVGQVNALRSDDPYTDLPPETSDFGQCKAEDTKGAFAPPPCHKGDAARIWFSMDDRYHFGLTDEERERFERWSREDPVSPAELERESSVALVTGVHNPYVHGQQGDPSGSCPWETVLK